MSFLTVLCRTSKIFSFLSLRWASGPDYVKLASPPLLKNTSKTPTINISSRLYPSSPWSGGWPSPSKSTMMTKYGDRNSKSRDRRKRMSPLKAEGSQTLGPNLDSQLRSVMDWSSGRLWPNYLWIQFRLRPPERTLRSGKWRPQTCRRLSMCLQRDCTSLWLM